MQYVPGYVLYILKGSKGIGIPTLGFCPRIMDDSKTKYSVLELVRRIFFWLKNAYLDTHVENKKIEYVSNTTRNKPPGLINV